MPDIYDNALCTVNGKLLTQASSIQVEFQDNDKALRLLGGVFAPVPSQRIMLIHIDEYLPTSGPIFDWIQAYLDVKQVTFGVRLQGSGRTLISKGVLKAPGMAFAVAQNARFKVSFIGPPANFS